MTIVCGTDFSPLATRASRVAGLIAKAAAEPIGLTHAVGQWRQPSASADAAASLAPADRTHLADDVRRIAQLGVTVSSVVRPGEPDEVIVREAARRRASLIVIGAVGHRRLDRWLLGSCADRTAREATGPVLVVRNDRPFEQWLGGKRQLRVAVGYDSGPSARVALAWAGWLARLAPVELIVAQLVSPGPENRRAGASGPGMGVDLLPAAAAKLHRDLDSEVKAVLDNLPFRSLVATALGRIDQRLVALAEELDVDLIIVGSNQREGFRRWWRGSVSSGVLHAAPMSVAVVPLPPGSSRGRRAESLTEP